MFSRFTNALYSAVDALAPPHLLHEDFVWHWKSITRFYTGKSASNSVPIESTSIPAHLKEMLSILEQEEKEIELGNIGPCMEYMMQHKLLDTMCVLATSDSPPGMKQCMFAFITKSLNIIQQSLIPHVSICVPIQTFIKLCGEVVASPTETEEMEFLSSICNIIQENPHMYNSFFLGDTGPASRRNSSVSSSSSDSKEEKNEYVLIASLLKLYGSPDNNISNKAKECIKTLCSGANDTISFSIVQSTSLSRVLCSSMIAFYKNMPVTIKIQDLENPIFEEEEGVKISPDMRKYLCYLQHLNFIDTVCETAHPLISDDICTHFKTEFLDSCIYPSIIENENIDNLLYVTTLVSCSIRAIKSPKLIDSFARHLLDDDIIQDVDLAESYKLTLKDILIERCNNCKADVALAICTLQLFEELLIKPTQFILNNLVLKYITSRGYYDHTASDSWFQFSDDDACSRYSDDVSEESGPSSKLYVNRIIEAFIALLPDDIKSCESDEESGYETYIKEAHNRFIQCLIVCENFDWPANFPEKEENHNGTEDDSSSESQPEADSARWNFYEGPFLRMIFDKLEQMLSQPYEINLQLTAIVSRLALFANPHIHEYFLNPLIPYVPGVRTLFTVLFKLSEDIQKDVSSIGGFKTKLKLTRNALLSDGNEYATFEESNVLEALIVFEEFCKELAAITFVKYHAV
ncbi:FHF complex subunit HOOK interacting protein 2A-like [Parasteatoda tepidariorum]|uniref:FHF complex subunit HOOK interacting protein 2A-like n=1 Tax=Parasteatoda tepidariorum TaxID=114398 RepID=UPI001C720696|nr:FHF complex subunit HOOK interacting protein 2A-like [Parasteatoda tepidariorum]